MNMLNDSNFENQIEQAASNPDMFLKILSDSIRQKLDKSFEELMQILYRLDVSEAKVQRVLHQLPQNQWAESIAQLIVDREKQRLEYRKRFSSGNQS